jgi:hypothetical protein
MHIRWEPRDRRVSKNDTAMQTKLMEKPLLVGAAPKCTPQAAEC